MNIKDETFYNNVSKKMNDCSNLRYYLPRFEDFYPVELNEHKGHSGYKGIDPIEWETIDSVTRDLIKSHNLGIIESVTFAYGMSVLYYYRDSDISTERVIYNEQKPYIALCLKGSTGMAMIFVDTSPLGSNYFISLGIYYSGLKKRYSRFGSSYALPLRAKVLLDSR